MVGEFTGSNGEPSTIVLLNGHSIKFYPIRVYYKGICQYLWNLWVTLRPQQKSFFVLWIVVEEEACVGLVKVQSSRYKCVWSAQPHTRYQSDLLPTPKLMTITGEGVDIFEEPERFGRTSVKQMSRHSRTVALQNSAPVVAYTRPVKDENI